MFQELMPSLRLGSWAPASLRKHLFGDEAYSMDQLCEMMMASDGEYSSLLLAERILAAYDKLNEEGKLAFFELLTHEYDLDVEALQEAVNDYASTADVKTLRTLTDAAETRRHELVRRLNLAPGATTRLVKMRQHLLELARNHPELRRSDVDFRNLFTSWFNRGFLLMQPIDWKTPAHILEKIIAYEAVHEIGRWAELRMRLEPEDRHCFAFFHPAMEDEPLVFVEVALTTEIPQNIDDVLGERREQIRPEDAVCAIFYSISNCHAGLAGVSFGNFLIKQVATHLKQQFPHLKKFSTLSPVPGFRSWLDDYAKEDSGVATLLDQIASEPEAPDGDEPDVKLREDLQPLLARYLLSEKNHRGEPLDPVARFHLKNGAFLERLNFAADRSAKGMKQSIGFMVNYIYDLSQVEQNHERYVNDQVVACSSQIRKMHAA